MPEYCTAAQLTKRLTEQLKKHVADRDRSGTVTPAESAASIDWAIAKAGNEIDFAIVSFCLPADARAQAANGTCPWLSDRGEELASYYFCTIGGADAPASVKDAYDRAKEKLDNVQQNQGVVPGLQVTRPHNGRHCGSVMVVNPS